MRQYSRNRPKIKPSLLYASFQYYVELHKCLPRPQQISQNHTCTGHSARPPKLLDNVKLIKVDVTRFQCIHEFHFKINLVREPARYWIVGGVGLSLVGNIYHSLLCPKLLLFTGYWRVVSRYSNPEIMSTKCAKNNSEDTFHCDHQIIKRILKLFTVCFRNNQQSKSTALLMWGECRD